MPAIELPDADAQCIDLATLIRPRLSPETVLVGIHSGGVWVARRLRELLPLENPIGLIDVSFYRDDYGEKGLHPGVKPTSIPFDVEGRPLILVDDVLYTGRTTRAAINELFDYGRPASIQLAVLADRGRRQLPICADYCTWRVDLDPSQELVLSANDNGRLQWSVAEHA
ncbi:MAG: bifunctional pyr operon transcriptional regulator/uracil phosphoribosyltransferase PyrR [Candidatus Accumulibacter sp.]|uniref:bifunctional pyr operon transcriptional regulator/uracil phosphoribosyltransferase PyrR n=1 Tax=Accumulibacter sp. TaxID=2053492 RepID=UPI0019F62EB1|nr:bifunctional pyr operon transcriptional regulator/uracil phosphoribosyltransferase PyrR [Accumulibacter sp.]MBE2258578.1 bifunctional pyr operon transcriptional regulator/uracil phosphoribosyltransferase PyrR [Paracoccaceae bacterium]MCB1941083.1 bifunctional pyr operon transcriptional regulator/uracil phosphoribosyltransferase PyrR [Accumulibacter sp.]MCP5248220.1 bifunctional pyr operon transcriptional regulator/uracil phosphoribosyltransferase PyrR [Accumulibacter sp.]